MLNGNLLIEKNIIFSKKRVMLNSQKKYFYSPMRNTIGLQEIKHFICFVGNIKKTHKLSFIPIVLNLGNNIEFEDKLTYILFECVCYELIENEKCNLSVFFHCPHDIYTEGIKSSGLKYLNGTKEGTEAFLGQFRRHIQLTHYRRIVEINNSTIEETSQRMQDIDTFLKGCFIQDSCRDKISNIVGELIDNSLEHSKADCLIDIDVTSDYGKNDCNPEDAFCGVNITVVNFSDILMGDGIDTKIDNLQDIDVSKKRGTERYLDVIKAKEYHSNFWNKAYNRNDFNIITSFQHKISSRLSTFSTGGTGLTHLIRGLEDESDAYMCYVLSGNRQLRFIKKFLNYNEENWVGFNLSENYLSDIPDPQCIGNSELFFPGTAYNLNFVIKREENKYDTEN